MKKILRVAAPLACGVSGVLAAPGASGGIAPFALKFSLR
jgi:hypothetical protein